MPLCDWLYNALTSPDSALSALRVIKCDLLYANGVCACTHREFLLYYNKNRSHHFHEIFLNTIRINTFNTIRNWDIIKCLTR